MKIFAWVHKKLQLGSTEYQRVANRNSPDVLFVKENNGKGGTTQATRKRENDTETLLLPHMLLTIGTFGHSTLASRHQEERPALDQQDEEIKQSAHDSTNGKQSNVSTVLIEAANAKHSSAEKIEINLNNPIIGELDKHVGQQVVVEEEIISEEPLLKEDKQKIEMKRITLADLFAEETATATAAAASAHKLETTAAPTKKVKKHKNREDSPHSAKKIHRLITRMLKKRIHPDATVRAEDRNGRRGVSSHCIGRSA